MSYIEEFGKWKTLKIYESFEKIFEQGLKIFPDWAKLTIDAAISGTPSSDYKLTLVKTQPTAQVDTSFKTEGYDVVVVDFTGVNVYKKGSKLIVADKGPMTFYAKSSEPWYLYQTKRFAQEELDPATRMYYRNGGPVSNAVKRVSKKGLTSPAGVPAEIEGNTLNWAKNNDQINDAIWSGEDMKSHLFAYMAQQGKIEELKNKLNDKISEQTGNYKLTIKNPGIRVADNKPSFEKVEESLKLNESRVIATDIENQTQEEKEKSFIGFVYSIVGSFLMKEDETRESPRVKKWIDEQYEKGNRVYSKAMFSRDPRDLYVLYALQLKFDQVEVQRLKDGRIKVFVKDLKSKAKALKKTVLSLKDDKTYKSELEEERRYLRLLSRLQEIYGERRMVGEKSREEVDKRIMMVKDREDLLVKGWSEKEQLKRLERFRELFTPIFKGYSTMEDVLGLPDDNRIFKWASPIPRKTLIDIRRAVRDGKIDEFEGWQYEQLFYFVDVERQNEEIKQARADARSHYLANRTIMQQLRDEYVNPAIDKTKEVSGKVQRQINKAFEEGEQIVSDIYKDSFVEDAVDWTEQEIVNPSISAVKDFMGKTVDSAKDWFEKYMITPLGVYLNINFKEAKINEIVNPKQAGGEQGYLTGEIKTEVFYKTTRAKNNPRKSNTTNLNISFKANYDIDLKTKEIKITGLSITGLTMGWLTVEFPGRSEVNMLKFKIRYSDGQIYADVKLEGEPDKSEGDDWWEWYDKLKNDILAYTYSIKITSALAKGVNKFIKKAKPVNLKELGLKNLPM